MECFLTFSGIHSCMDCYILTTDGLTLSQWIIRLYLRNWCLLWLEIRFLLIAACTALWGSLPHILLAQWPDHMITMHDTCIYVQYKYIHTCSCHAECSKISILVEARSPINQPLFNSNYGCNTEVMAYAVYYLYYWDSFTHRITVTHGYIENFAAATCVTLIIYIVIIIIMIKSLSNQYGPLNNSIV